MDSFGAHELRQLIEEQGEPCVSIYLPTHVSGSEGQQDPVRVKNLLQQVEDQLAAGWMRGPEARDFVEPARALTKQAKFWRNRSHGLAMFLAPGVFYAYRVPVAFDELAVVNRRFTIKPLLPLLAGQQTFWILTLSQNQVHLFTASPYGIEAVEVPGLPTSMDEALNYTGADRGSQVHSATNVRLGKEAAVFHGQGGQPDTRKDELMQYFRLIDAAIAPVVRRTSDPVLLAGVGYLLPLYRQVSHLTQLSTAELAGNWDHLTAYQLHQRALPVVEPLMRQQREAAAAKFRQLLGTGKTSENLREILPAARHGQVETLFVDAHARQWGALAKDGEEVDLHETPHKGDEDLLDLAAVETLTHRGTVYSVEREELPSGAVAAAVLRY
jgi:hypothetical protein